jgi:hypothetical protein
VQHLLARLVIIFQMANVRNALVVHTAHLAQHHVYLVLQAHIVVMERQRVQIVGQANTAQLVQQRAQLVGSVLVRQQCSHRRRNVKHRLAKLVTNF